MNGKLMVVVLVLTIFLSSCTTLYNKATGKHELMFISNDEEVNIGNNVNTQIIEKMELSKSKNDIDRVTKIGKNIVSKIDTRGISYKFFVVEDPNMNAFTIPGGYVYATTGLLRNIKSDDELASVLAHEIGHSEARHAVKRMEAAMGYSALMTLAYNLDKRSDSDKQIWTYLQTGSSVVFNLITLGYSRKDEYEADRLAVKYTKQAGYNPYSVITMFQKLKLKHKENNKNWTYFLRSHPYIDERIAEVQKILNTKKK